MYDDVEDTDEEPDVDDIEVNAEVGYTIKSACTQMLKGECQKIFDFRFFDDIILRLPIIHECHFNFFLHRR
jgi:hypothetical protein